MERKLCCGVYMITSPIGNRYIGQSMYVHDRIRSYSHKCGGRKQRKLNDSLQKYGHQNHKFEVLEYCQKDDLKRLEEHYMEVYDTFNTEIGLNLIKGKEASLETRIRYSDAVRLQHKYPSKARLLGRKKQREALSGRRVSAEARENMSINCPHRKPVIQIDKNTNEELREFRSIGKAQEFIGKRQHINQVCDGTRKTSGGYKWRWKNE